MMNKKTILLLAQILIASACFAQQDPQYTQYLFNCLSINPAYAAKAEVLTATALHRSQWVGFDGAPTTQTLTLQAPLSKKNVGLGLSIHNDKIGPSKETGFYGDYAYRLNFHRNHLAFGINGGFDILQKVNKPGDYINQVDDL